MLLAGSLACGGGQPNIDATVNAVSTAVELTLVALTQPAGSTPAPSTATPQPTLGILPTQPSPASATIAPPPDSSATPPPLGPTPTVEGLVRPNGPLFHAARRDTPPTLDAQSDDWGGQVPVLIDQIVFGPANWAGTGDQSGSVTLGWDTNNLYLFVVVTDDVHAQTQPGELLYRGDSLELQLDADLPTDFSEPRINADDFQLGLSPGSNRDNPEAYLWNPVERRGVPAGLAIVSRSTGGAGGYALEAAIPWTMYGVTPAPGLHFGFALNSSDNDNPGEAVQQSMISTVITRTLLDPTTWGTLQLDP